MRANIKNAFSPSSLLSILLSALLMVMLLPLAPMQESAWALDSSNSTVLSVGAVDSFDSSDSLQLLAQSTSNEITQVVAESSNSAAIVNGSLWVWGDNSCGQIGDGTTIDRPVPVKVMDNVKEAYIGSVNVGALKDDGSFWVWGDNSVGQLGNGTTVSSSKPEKLMDGVRTASIGGKNVAIVKNDASLWTLGLGLHGALGNGSTSNSGTPVKIMDGVASVSMGGSYRGAAVKTDGSLWSWGWSYKGATLGNGTAEGASFDQKTPVQIMSNVSSVDLNAFGGAALKNDGTLWTWGIAGGRAILGQYNSGDNAPKQVLSGVKCASAANYCFAAVKNDNSLVTWGEATNGALGNGKSDSTSYDASIIQDAVSSVDMGSFHGVALTQDGRVLTWGDGNDGQLGNGDTASTSSPAEIVIINSNYGSFTGKVCRASDRAPVKDAEITVINSEGRSFSTKAASDGSYSITAPADSSYQVMISASGYVGFTYYASLQKGENAYLETFLLVTGSADAQGISKGTIINAKTSAPVSGVSLQFRKGWGASAGSVVANATSGSDGTYSVNLPQGNYTMRMSKSGFVTADSNVVSQSGEGFSQDAVLNPVGFDNEYRFVLTWGDSPRDLDSHLEGSLSTGDEFHVYYSAKSKKDGDVTVCNLDVDDTSSYGPETTTLIPTAGKAYYYYIHRYSSDGSLSASGAQIKVYRGSSLIQTFNVPTNQGDSRYWNVCAVAGGKLIENNTLSASPDTLYAKDSEGPSPLNEPNDGSTSLDDYMIAEVEKYTSSGVYAQFDAISQSNCSFEEKFQRYNALFNSNGITDVREGIQYLSSTVPHRSAYNYLTTNEIYCAYNWYEWLYTTVKGFAARSLLYTSGLIFNYELMDYINFVDLSQGEYPGAEKCKAMLKSFMEIDDDNGVSDVLSNANLTAKYLKNLVKLNNAVETEEMDALMDQILACTSKSKLEKLQSQYVDKMLAQFETNSSRAIYLNGQQFADALGKSATVLKFVGATADDIIGIVNLSKDIETYKSYGRFLDRIQEDAAVSFDMRYAAYQLKDEISNGYYKKIISMAGNCFDLAEGLLFTDKSMMQMGLEKAGISEAASGTLSGALGTISLATFIDNIIVDTGDFVKQAAYTEAYAELGASFAYRLEHDKQAFLADKTAANAWTFFEDYTMLWKLRYKGEQQYLDMNTVKAFIFAKVKLSDYSLKEDMVKETLAHLDTVKFDVSDQCTIPDSVQYSKKAVVNCPVDVEVRSANGALIATLKDGQESDVTNSYGRFAVVKDSYSGDYVKVICLNSAGNVSIKSTAVSDGYVSMKVADVGKAEIKSIDNELLVKGSSLDVDTKSLADNGEFTVDHDGDGEADRTGTATSLQSTEVPAESISANQTELDIAVGASETIQIEVNPESASNKAVAWASSDDSVATVVDGTIMGVGEGQATISCTSLSNPDAYAEFSISVSSKASTSDPDGKIAVSSIKASAAKTTLNVGESTTITTTVLPSDATNKAVTYESSDTAILAVSASGKVTAKEAGTAKVTVTSSDNCEAAQSIAFKVVTLESDASNGTEESGNASISAKPDASSDTSGKPSVSNASISGLKAKTYTGKKITQKPTVKLGGETLKPGTDYTISYKNNVKAGTATVVVTGKDGYTGTKSATFKINKAKQPLTVKAKSKSAKAKSLKKKALAAKKLVTVKKAKGKVTYKNVSKAKKLKKFKVNAKNGAITVPKGTKKGTYKVKVKATAKGDANYKSGSKTATVKIVVK